MTFSIDILLNDLINEDIDLKTKPAPSANFKYPCSLCGKSVMSNQKAIQCDNCDLWAHIKCDGTTVEEYNRFMALSEVYDKI